MLTESSVSLLLGHSKDVIQRRIMLTQSSVSLLTGTFPGCYKKENFAYSEFRITPYWDIPRVLYKRELCLLRVQYHRLTGTFPGLLNYRGGQAVLFSVFSLLGQAQVGILHRRYL